MWVAAGEGHSSSRPARWWAELIGLEDPGVAGARAIKGAAAELAKRNLITLEPPSAPGGYAAYTLLRESGDGSPYTIPEGTSADQYFRVPETLWTNGLIAELSASGLACYLAVLSVYRTNDPDMSISFTDGTYRNRFGLSPSTRKSGFADLVAADVLDVTLESVDDRGGRTGRTYRRNVYRLRRRWAPPPQDAGTTVAAGVIPS